MLAGAWQVAILTLIWVLGIAGIGLSVLTIGVTRLNVQVPRWAATALYIAMGWVAIFALPEFLRVLPWTAVALLFLGGALNTVGAVIYARKRPNPFPACARFPRDLPRLRGGGRRGLHGRRVGVGATVRPPIERTGQTSSAC